MLVDFWDRRKQITRGWFPAKFQAWKGQLSQAQIAAIHAEINRMIDAGKAAGKAIQTTSWMPGSDWTGARHSIRSIGQPQSKVVYKPDNASGYSFKKCS